MRGIFIRLTMALTTLAGSPARAASIIDTSGPAFTPLIGTATGDIVERGAVLLPAFADDGFPQPSLAAYPSNPIATPESAFWMMTILGFGGIGRAVRLRKTNPMRPTRL